MRAAPPTQSATFGGGPVLEQSIDEIEASMHIFSDAGEGTRGAGAGAGAGAAARVRGAAGVRVFASNRPCSDLRMGSRATIVITRSRQMARACDRMTRLAQWRGLLIHMIINP